jgi:hypothetical protein
VITQGRLEEINKIAFHHVASFVKKKSVQPHQLIALQPRSPSASSAFVNNDARDFADHVVLSEYRAQWGTQGLPSLREAELLPLFQQFKMNSRDEMLGFPSWLYLVAHLDSKKKRTGCPMFAAVFDITFIDAKRVNSQSPETVVNRLFFHELGHFVLHRDDLFGKPPFKDDEDSIPADKCTPEQEEEAWIYAGAIVTICLGDHAFSKRRAGEPDDTWLIV